MYKKIIGWLLFFTLICPLAVFGQENGNAYNVIYAARPTLAYKPFTNMGGGYFSATTYFKELQQQGTRVLDSAGNTLGRYTGRVGYAGEGFYYVGNEKETQLMNHKGEIVAHFPYTFSNWMTPLFSEGMACVETGNYMDRNFKKGFIDIAGNLKIPYQYEDAGDFREGLAWVRKDGKCGYINKEGEIVIPMLYNSASDFENGRAFVSLYNEENPKTLVIDTEGKELASLEWAGAPTVKNGYLYTEKIINHENGEHSHIQVVYDQSGNRLSEEEGNLVRRMSEGLWSEGLQPERDSNQKWGYVDKDGKAVIPFLFDEAKPFWDGYAIVELDGKYGIIKNPLTNQ